MNKLEKILAQSVTSEMVAEQLTEQEIEEVIEEYEEKAKHAEESIEYANKKEEEFSQLAERYRKTASEWKAEVEKEKEKSELYRSVVKKAKQALAERFTGIAQKEESPDNSFVHTTPDGKVLRVVKRRAKVGEWVVIIDDSELNAFKVGDVQLVKGICKSYDLSTNFEVIGSRELGFFGFDHIDHKQDYYVVIEELPF